MSSTDRAIRRLADAINSHRRQTDDTDLVKELRAKLKKAEARQVIEKAERRQEADLGDAMGDFINGRE